MEEGSYVGKVPVPHLHLQHLVPIGGDDRGGARTLRNKTPEGGRVEDQRELVGAEHTDHGRGDAVLQTVVHLANLGGGGAEFYGKNRKVVGGQRESEREAPASP